MQLFIDGFIQLFFIKIMKPLKRLSPLVESKLLTVNQEADKELLNKCINNLAEQVKSITQLIDEAKTNQRM